MKRSQNRQGPALAVGNVEVLQMATPVDHFRPGVQGSTNSLTALLKMKPSSGQPHAILEVWLLRVRLLISIACCILLSEELTSITGSNQ